MYDQRDRVCAKMRRVRKKVSITRYISAYLLLMVCVLSFLMLLFINILADWAIHYDIQSSLVKELVKNNKNVVFKDNVIQPNEKFENQDDGICFQIINEKGVLLVGENPKGVQYTGEVGHQRLHTFNSGGKKYYIIERVNRRMTKATGHIIYNRAIAETEEMNEKYLFIKYIIYGSIPVLFGIVLIVGLMMSKKISVPLVQMAKTAVSIGKEGELSRRIEYDGRITELASLADTSNYMLERVENMFESQKRFSSDVAHELRTPIAVLVAQCEYAKEHAGTKEEFDEALDVMYRQAQRTNRVINQLLNLNRLESGRVQLDLEESDIDELLCSICDDIELKEKGKVTFDFSLGGGKASVDLGLAFIMFQNLIQNAVKYSEEPAVVEIESGNRENETYVRISDSGCGIAKEDLKKIFTPFYRVEEARNSEGFGLGLSLARRIAQMHGGDIQAESSLGKGSTFSVIIPRYHEQENKEKNSVQNSGNC